MEGWKKFWSAVTGEWMFRWGCPNGGTIIFFRSVQVTVILYVIASWLASLFNATWPWHHDFGFLWHQGADSVSWLGAIFAAVYAALYARFASQWSYLAGVYNQMRQTLVTTKEPDRDHLVMWRAAFIEDALDLHLATKPMFAPFLLRMLDMPAVAAKFDAYTVDGWERRKDLEENLRKRDGHLPRRAGEGLLRLLTELPGVLGLGEAAKADLRALSTTLGDKHVFQDLSEDDARRVALAIAWASVIQRKECADAAPVLMEQAAQTGAEDFWDNKTAARLALDRAAMVLRDLPVRR